MRTSRLIGFAICLLIFPATNANADFINGGFEDGSFNGWNVQDLAAPFYPITVATFGSDNSFGWPWSSSPTEGQFAAYHGFDGDPVGAVNQIRLSQDLVVTGDTLEFDYRHAWDLTFGATQDRTFEVNIEVFGGGANLQSTTILTAQAGETVFDTGALSATVDVSAFLGDSVRISFDWTIPEPLTGPAAAQLDNVRFTGAKIPEPGSTAVLLLCAGFLARRKR